MIQRTKNSKLILTVLAMMMSVAAFAQNLTVTGTVTDSSTGEPVPFAAIQLKGTMTGGMTDADGLYSITVPSDGILIFSSVGYKETEVAVAGKAVHDVVMAPDTEMIEETIVVAFGTATKESFTGSATVVNSSDISKVQSSDVTRALEGMVAGVQMTTSTGTLGSTPSIVIRGHSSINAGNAPLYVVDGVPYDGDINNLNNADIESMTVLKDAASNALYGARGANGVIMITTKKAKAGDAIINVDAKWGLNTKALEEYDVFTNPAQYYEAHYAALYNYYVNSQGMIPSEAHIKANSTVTGPAAGGGLGYQVFTVPEGQAFIGANGKVNPNATLGKMYTYNGKNYWMTPDNWMDETYKKSLRQEYNVSVSGRHEKGAFLASFGYLNNKGIIDASDMYRYTARLKGDYQAKEWFKLGANMSYTNYSYNNGNSDEGSSGSTGNIFAFASRIAPIYPLYLRDGDGNIMKDSHGYLVRDYGNGENGGLVRPFMQNSNPLQTLALDKNNAEGNAITTQAFAELSFLKDFKFTFNAGTGMDETRSTSMNNPYYGQFATQGGIVSKGHTRSLYLNLQQLLNYTKTVAGVHHISALVGHEWYKRSSVSLSASKSQMSSIDNTELNGAGTDGMSAASSRSTYNNEGYFSRVQYDYMNRIFGNASFRRDASSRFHPDHRWGNFWSLGAAWIISEEGWFNARAFNMLKLKASYGSQGNDNISNFLYVDTYQTLPGTDGLAPTFYNKGNENITWETNANFNVGAEFGLWNDRLSGSVEYFFRNTTDMLYFYSLASSSGYGGYYDNLGDMRNAGVEIALNGNIINRREMRLDVYANATHYTNKVTMLPDENKTTEHEGYWGFENGSNFIAEGLPLTTFFMPQYAGVNKETGEAMWYKDTKDADGNVTKGTTTNYSEATDYICGNPTPLFYGGFGASFQYKGFDVAASFTYSLGGLAYDSGYASYMSNPTTGSGSNYHKDILKAWTPENPDSNIPRWQYGDQYPASQSDRFLVDASYLNFQNAQVGYTLPENITRKFKVAKLRIYAACDNIVYWSQRKGLDPRFSLTGSTNNAVNSPVRTLSGGVNITF